MSQSRRRRALGAGVVSVGMVAAVAITTAPAMGAPQYTRIDQSSMTAVAADSVENSGEGVNGPIGLVLDGDDSTYWHTQWKDTVAPTPHWFVIKLADKAVDLARVDLTPRQSSNGSGRVHEYKLFAVNTPQCTKDSFGTASPVTSGQFDGLVANKAQVRSIVLDNPVKATCVKVQYDSSWGGASGSADTSPTEQVASLAEFNAFTASTSSATPTTPAASLTPQVPKGTLSIGDGTLSVRLRPDFPQVIDYALAGRTLVGRYGGALSSMTIDGKVQKVKVSAPTVSADKHSASYPVTVPGLRGVHLTAVVSVAEDTLTYKLTDIVDPGKLVHRIAIPGLDLVSLTGADAKSRILAAGISVSRDTSGDKVIDVAKASPGTGSAWMVTANSSTLAAGFETNAIGDNTVPHGGGTTARFVHTVKDVSGTTVASVSPAQWTYRSGAVTTHDDGSGIGPDDDPTIQVRLTADANADGTVDWQDGAIATRHILAPIVGAADVPNDVIAHIPFNIVSQATHPFLRTLDDVKRISLATDGLGQQVLLKGYQAEGHDSAQGDYAGHYNGKAGGLTDLRTLVNQGKSWNATFGIHVNATESYSEAKAFGPDLLQMPPQKAWGWMNQAYYVNSPKDLATGAVLQRLTQLRKDFPADSNLNWLYWDVYYPRGWQGDRFAAEVAKQGWRQGSEWADAMPRSSTWSHWANDENYGGSNNKGLNSQLIRFVENSYRDTWNPDPMLGNTNVVEFEGWTGHNDYNAFIANVWQRNLPTKFMQRSPIVGWSNHEVKLADGTVATSPLDSIDGRTIPTDRTITTDGAVVYHDGTYLLPWKDGGSNRLYYWNPSGKAATWQLTKAWASQSSLTLFKLTDTGRVKVADLPVSDGKVTLPATEADTAYVLYPTSAIPEAATPNWGAGSHIADPGFFSGTTKAYRTSGSVHVTKSDRGNFQAELGTGASSLSQQLTLPAGTYSAWAWVQVQPGATRHVEVSVSGSGIAPAGHQGGRKGEAVTSIGASTAPNATASDEKVGTYFQRVPVRFSTNGAPATLTVRAGEGSAIVSVDDLRVVPTTIPKDPAPAASTVVYEDFEHIDDGYGPFVTGSANASGDARTQLAERHAPYSQSGWYGLVDDSARTATQGQKYLDNVLDGHWSLMAHQENGGLILRTTQSLVPLAKGHTYRVSFDYQTAYDDDYSLVVGHDSATGGAWKATTDRTVPITRARGAGWHSGRTTGSGTKVFSTEFTAGDNAFLGVVKQGSKVQGDLVIDRFRVDDLGAKPVLSVSSKAVTSSDPTMRELTVTGSLALSQGSATDVRLALTGPRGWTVTPVTTAASNVSTGHDAVASWTVKVPRNADPGNLVVKATWTLAGKAGKSTESIPIDPEHFPLVDPIGGSDLTLVEASSEQTGDAEPAPNGPAAAAIDGDPSTYWHTQWDPTVDSYPHSIVIRPTASLTTGTTCQINALEYTARQNAANGRAKGYQVFASRDAKTWGDPVASGDFADVTTPQVVEFTKPMPGPFVKLVETSSQNGAQFGGAGGIRLSASCSGPVAPTVTPVPTVTPTPTVAPTTAPTSATPSDSASPSHPGTWDRPEATRHPGESGRPKVPRHPAGRPDTLPHTGASGDHASLPLAAVVLLTSVAVVHLPRR